MKRRESKLVATVVDSLSALPAQRDPLQRLDLVRLAREAAEDLEQSYIDAARADGRTWAEIGSLYGLTKQGAQQRFRRDRPPASD